MDLNLDNNAAPPQTSAAAANSTAKSPAKR